MIQISQEELWGFNVLDGQVRNIMTETQRLQAARDAYIKLLELKYNATFDPKTGTFEEKDMVVFDEEK